jgi:hypothetical protein
MFEPQSAAGFNERVVLPPDRVKCVRSDFSTEDLKLDVDESIFEAVVAHLQGLEYLRGQITWACARDARSSPGFHIAGFQP